MSNFGSRFLALLVVLAAVAGLMLMLSEQRHSSVPASHIEPATPSGPDTSGGSSLSTETAPAQPAPESPSPP